MQHWITNDHERFLCPSDWYQCTASRASYLCNEACEDMSRLGRVRKCQGSYDRCQMNRSSCTCHIWLTSQWLRTRSSVAKCSTGWGKRGPHAWQRQDCQRGSFPKLLQGRISYRPRGFPRKSNTVIVISGFFQAQSMTLESSKHIETYRNISKHVILEYPGISWICQECHSLSVTTNRLHFSLLCDRFPAPGCGAQEVLLA